VQPIFPAINAIAAEGDGVAVPQELRPQIQCGSTAAAIRNSSTNLRVSPYRVGWTVAGMDVPWRRYTRICSHEALRIFDCLAEVPYSQTNHAVKSNPRTVIRPAVVMRPPRGGRDENKYRNASRRLRMAESVWMIWPTKPHRTRLSTWTEC
jgi:hypothetical protein